MSFEFIVVIGAVILTASLYLISRYVEKVRVQNKDPKGSYEILLATLFLGGFFLMISPLVH